MRFSCLAGSRQRKSFGNFLQSAIVATFAAWIIISGFAKGDDCRNIHFKEKIENMALTEHVIKSDRVLGEEICRINCYVEPNCASYNYGPVENELHLCELNDKNHLQVPSDELEERNGFIYRLVFPTSCLSNPCPSNSTCQTGYGDQGYRCVCPYGYHGDKCQLDIEECVSGSHNCSPNAICMDIPGSFQCNCTSGYTGDGVNCKAEVLACASVTQLEGSNIYEVNADHGSWPADGFCRVFSKVEINAGDSYTMTVELMNVIGWLGVNSGHLGVFYNAVDENNFDLIYFRPNNIHRCYQPGHFLNGVFMRSVEGPCPNHPRGGVWLTLRVEVSSDQSVNIFLNNDLVTSLTAHFNTKGRGGVLVANGFQNIVQFREFDITAAL